MRVIIPASAATVLGACLLFAPASSQAAPVNANVIQQAGSAQAAPLIEVRSRRARRHARHYARRHHWRGHHWRHHGYWRGYDYDDDWGGALAAGAIFGLAAGAIASNAWAGNSAVAYCMRRFRSYDPASGTYLGYDGYRHPCP